MDLQLPEFQQMVRDRNEMTKVALEWAVLVLRRARELTPEQQRPMIGLLRELISREYGESDLPVKTDCSEHPPLVIPPRTVAHLGYPHKEL